MEIECSIIIPAYNSAKVIENCLRSIEVNKKYWHSIEVLVIDDGSEDNTSELVKVWNATYANVRLFKKKNGGVSSARNVGLNEARGKYIYFSDADDCINREVLDEMIECANQTETDVIIADHTELNVETKRKKYVSCAISQGKKDREFIEKEIFSRYFNGKTDGLATLWNKLFRKEIIEKNGLYFDEKRSHGEDWAFNIQYFLSAKTLFAFSKSVYIYKLDGSQSYHKYSKRLAYSLINGHFVAQSLNERFLHYQKESEEYIRFMARFAAQSLMYLSLDSCSDEEKKRFLSSKEEKGLWNFLLKLDKRKLSIASYSRKDKIAFLLLKASRYKMALKLLRRI